MSEPIFEQCVDERGNISVRVSRDVQVLTREEANRIEAEYKRMQAENAKLREFIGLKKTCWKYVGWCDECPYNGVDDEHDDCNCTVREKVSSLARELGVEVDG